MKAKLRMRLPLFVMEGPAFLWMALFVLVPLFYVAQISLMTKNSSGGVIYALSVDGYTSMFTPEFLTIMWRSLLLSFETTVLCIVVGYPFAYIIAHRPKRHMRIYVMLIMLPFWINSVIRIYGWNTLLRTEGVINMVLQRLGLIDKPLPMLYNDGAVLLGMVYELLPFMVLPLYTSIEKLDHSLMEAASDLGAKRHRVFVRIILPLTMPGVFAGCIQTFVPALGLFYISEMMGGGSSMYIGNLIKNQFLSARDWPLGAALSILLIVITLILIRLYTLVGSLEDMA